MVAATLSRLTPVSIRNTATVPVVILFLAFSVRNTIGVVLRFEKGRSAHFVGIVAVLRFAFPLLEKIAPKGVLELHQVIALRRSAPDADRVRYDFERLEQACQTVLRERFASFPFRPRAALDVDQGVDELAGWQSFNAALKEGCFDVGQQLNADGLILDRCARCLEGAPRTLRPIAADNVSYRQQPAPIVGEPIEDAGRHRRVSRPQAHQIIHSPARRLASEIIEMRSPIKPKRLDWLAIESTLQFDGDGAIGQCARELSDQGDCTGRISCKLPRLEIIADGPQD